MTDDYDNTDFPSEPVAELRGHKDGPIHIVRFTADGKYCITGANDRTVRLWNPTRIDPAYRPPPAASPAHSVAHGAHISSQEYYGRPQRPREPPSALPMQTYADGHLHPIHSVATNSSSTVLLSASDKTLLATDLVTAQTRQKWWGHVARIEYVACLGGGEDSNGDGSSGEEIYATASYDSTVRLWDARSRSKEPLMVLDQAKDAVTCIASGKESEAQIITSSVDGKIRTYDLRTAQLITEDIVHPITSFSISNDGASIAATCLDGIIRVWGLGDDISVRMNSRKKIFQKLHSSHKSNNYKVECAFTSNNEYLVSGSECGAVVIYPVDSDSGDNNRGMAKPPTNPATKLQRHTGPTCSVATCPQKSRPWLLVSASYDGTAVVWASRAQHDCVLE
mmetsp:Transcript_32995/g.79819  ORF Transcript_32995/g.79819 Transcript_32995/m.79819 type:complete len:394 (+) Transcript_32995:130-1311(+)